VPRLLFSKKLLTLFFLILFATSCSSNKEAIPGGIIEPAKMSEILTDMQIVESALMHIQQSGMNADKYKKTLYNLIFEKHKIKRESFEKSFKYYTKNNIQLLDKIYADVITSLSQKQSLIRTQ